MNFVKEGKRGKRKTKMWIHPSLYKKRFFSTQPRYCLTFSWIELEMLLRWFLIDKSIIILRHFLYLLDLCPCLDLGLFMSYLCDLFLNFIFILIVITRIISWIQIYMLFSLFFRVWPIPAGIYLLKVNNRNTRTTCEICSKLTIKTLN